MPGLTAQRDTSPEPRRFGPEFSRFADADPSASEVVLNLTLAGVAAVNRVEDALAEFGLVLKSFSVLVAVAGADQPLTPTAIAQRTVISKTTLTSALDVLERLGLVRREPNPASRRSVLVRATEHGEDIAESALARLHSLEARWIEPMSETDRQRLITLLGQVKGLLGAAEVPAPSVAVGAGT